MGCCRRMSQQQAEKGWFVGGRAATTKSGLSKSAAVLQTIFINRCVIGQSVKLSKLSYKNSFL